jgi:hypothetical protein
MASTFVPRSSAGAIEILPRKSCRAMNAISRVHFYIFDLRRSGFLEAGLQLKGQMKWREPAGQ